MKQQRKCDIRQFSDMEKCIECGLCWDVNDPHPPVCELNTPYRAGFIERLFGFLFGDKVDNK